jgi:P27 family predicted phage terminase small subunit
VAAPVVELVAMAKPPAAPASLIEDGPGIAAWQRLWVAGASWLSAKTDFEVMVRYCQGLDERSLICGQISEDGYMVTGSMGQRRAHPLLGRLAVIDAQLLAIESKIGCTPADRARLGAVEARPPSVLAKLMGDVKARREADL